MNEIPKQDTEIKIVKPDQSDYSVAKRREWIGEQYLKGVPPLIIWSEYSTKYDLTKHSFDKDITYIRERFEVDLHADLSTIMNNEYTFLVNLRKDALKNEDTGTALRVQKQITDLIRLVAPSKATNQTNIQINNNSSNLNLPDLSVDEIRQLLQGENPNTINID